MKTISVSIITPLYNCSIYLEQTIQSVLAQTFQDWEMIIIDDCSTDSSVDVIWPFAERDSRVKLVQLSENSGAAVARNKAIEAASGRFIAFLDSDDLWSSDKLEKQVQFMLEQDIAFSFSAYEKIDEVGLPFQEMRVPSRVSYTDLLKTNVIGCLTAIYDTEKIGKVYMPSNNKREDFATWLNILKKIDYAYGMQELLAQYRVYGGQSSSRKTSMAKENWHLYRNVEKLNLFQASYYFSHYAIRGVLRTRFPRIAKAINA